MTRACIYLMKRVWMMNSRECPLLRAQTEAACTDPSMSLLSLSLPIYFAYTSVYGQPDRSFARGATESWGVRAS